MIIRTNNEINKKPPITLKSNEEVKTIEAVANTAIVVAVIA